jgi:hypothetical protein
MASSIKRASDFMAEMHQLKYYGVLSILYQMQDTYFKDKKGSKEILFLNDVIMDLSHQNDLKITHNNGFHVNRSLTGSNRIIIDSNCMHQDYDSFFKAA